MQLRHVHSKLNDQDKGNFDINIWQTLYNIKPRPGTCTEEQCVRIALMVHQEIVHHDHEVKRHLLISAVL